VREVPRPQAAWIGLIAAVSLETYALAVIYCHSLHNEPTRTWLASAIYTAIGLPLLAILALFALTLLSLALAVIGTVFGFYRMVDGKEGFYWWGYKGEEDKALKEAAKERAKEAEASQRRAEALSARIRAAEEAARNRTKREVVEHWLSHSDIEGWLDGDQEPPGI
jgi:hypothetical protein